MFSGKIFFNHIYQIERSMLCITYYSSKNSFYASWHKTNACVGNERIYVSMWYEHGAKIISDFLNEDVKFLSQHDFDQRRISLTNAGTMQYNTCRCSVIIAISKFFKTRSFNRSNVRKDCSPFITFFFQYILLNEKWFVSTHYWE